MNVQEDESLWKTKIKTKAVPLTDDEYNDIFNAVLRPTLNQDNNLELNEEHCISNSTDDFDKENCMPVSQNKSSNAANIRNECLSNANERLTKRKVPKFNVPVRGNSSEITSNLKHNKKKKFIPPNTSSSFSASFVSKTAKKNIGESETPELEENEIKLQREKNIGISKRDTTIPLHNVFANKTDPTTEKELQKTTQNFSQNVKKVSHNSHLCNSKKSNKSPMLCTIYKEADSTEKHTVPLKTKKVKEKMIDMSMCTNTSLQNRTICIHKEDIKKTQSENISTLCNELVTSERSSEINVDSFCSHTNNILSNITLSQASDGSIMNVTINDNSCTQLSQPSPEMTQRQRLEWLRQRRTVGVWVQCCKLHCSKWRYLENVKDPVEVPAYWVCHMNNDSRYNKCEKPEKGPRLTEQVDLINNKYTAGSVVWARVDGYPWWPALVDDDPDIEAYYWLNGFSDIPTHYHVVFFDDRDVTRAWVTPGNLCAFTGIEKQKKFNAKGFKGISYSSRMKVAKEQAKVAYALDLNDRLLQYGFLARYTGTIGKRKMSIFKGKNHNSTSESEAEEMCSGVGSISDDIPVKKKKLKRINNEKNKKTEELKTSERYSRGYKKMNQCKREGINNAEFVKATRKTKQFEVSESTKINGDTFNYNENGLEMPVNTEISQLNSTSMECVSHSTTFKDQTDLYSESKQSGTANTIFSINTADHSSLLLDETNVKQHCNKEYNLNKYVTLEGSKDIDPFEEEESINNLISNCGTNEEMTQGNKHIEDICSNLATVGTNVITLPQKQLCLSKDSNNYTSIKQTFSEIERQEADTSEDRNLSFIFPNISNYESYKLADSLEATNNKSYNTEHSQLFPQSQKKNFHDLLQTKDAVVPEILSHERNNEYDSDPFETDD